jgi:L-ribulose-5-phosphate 3-epimerase UlaE
VKNFIGVMQGRLLPKYLDQYQAHPVRYWAKEFTLAKRIGLDCIEFILDYSESESNPLLSHEGIFKIQRVIDDTGIAIKTICADYFMEQPLHSTDKEVVERSIGVLKKLLVASEQLGVTDIVIPCVDQSSLTNEVDKERFVFVIRSVVEDIESKNINLSLETDLPPKAFKKLLDQLNFKNITVNYDIGNSASLGFDSEEELDSYGHKISDVHIKDRILDGGSVVLGEGNADFERFFKKLEQFEYTGPFIMQAYRDNEGVSIFKKQLDWISQYLE